MWPKVFETKVRYYDTDYGIATRPVKVFKLFGFVFWRKSLG